MNIAHALSQLGLNKTEATVYTHLLKAGGDSKRNTVFEIAKSLKIPRSTVYLALDGLEEKKLACRYKQNNVLHFLAENPVQLKVEAEKRIDLLETLVPQLQAMQNVEEHQSAVKTYTGVDGVRTVFEEIYDRPHLKGIREFHSFAHPKLIQFMPKVLPRLLEYKKQVNIQTKMIAVVPPGGTLPPEYQSDSHRETRSLPKEFSFDGTMVIFGKRAALFSHKKSEVYSIILESETIVHMLDSIFLCFWQLLGPTRPASAARR